MNRILYPKSVPKTKVVTISIIFILVLFVGFFSLGFIYKNSNKILKGVHISALDVGNMTIEEAKNKLNEQQISLSEKKYVMSYDNREVTVSGEEIALKYVSNLVENAYSYGRDGNFFKNSMIAWKSLFNSKHIINAEFIYDKNILNEKVNILLDEMKEFPTNDYYEISGEKIIIFKGNDGVTVKTEEINQIISEVGLPFHEAEAIANSYKQ